MIKELKMEQLSWIIWVKLICNHKCPCKRAAEEGTTDRRWSRDRRRENQNQREDATPLVMEIEDRTTSQEIQP